MDQTTPKANPAHHFLWLLNKLRDERSCLQMDYLIDQYLAGADGILPDDQQAILRSIANESLLDARQLLVAYHLEMTDVMIALSTWIVRKYGSSRLPLFAEEAYFRTGGPNAQVKTYQQG